MQVSLLGEVHDEVHDEEHDEVHDEVDDEDHDVLESQIQEQCPGDELEEEHECQGPACEQHEDDEVLEEGEQESQGGEVGSSHRVDSGEHSQDHEVLASSWHGGVGEDNQASWVCM